MRPESPIPRFPAAGAWLLSGLPLAPLSLLLGRVIASAVAHHAALFARLGPEAEKRFLLDPVDLPMAFLLRPSRAGPRLEALSRSAARPWDCRIAGRLAALLGLIHGTYDGDALFFSRDLTIEGDTAAALALRNALDDAEIDLLDELLRSLGPAGAALNPGLRTIAQEIGGRVGVDLVRRAWPA